VTKSCGRFLIRRSDLPIPRVATRQLKLSVELTAFSWYWLASPQSQALGGRGAKLNAWFLLVLQRLYMEAHQRRGT
jgi:hypothetical protein